MQLAREITKLHDMTPNELRAKYLEVLGEPSRSSNRLYLIKRIAWRLQAQAEGGLSQRAHRRAAELANDAELRTTAPKDQEVLPPTAGVTKTHAVSFDHDPRLPLPGSFLVRKYKGTSLVVKVLPKGFEYEGEIYRSLSAVAKTITGRHWNGFHFFKLTANGDDNDR